MKVVIINNDLRAYWKDRIIFLRKFLAGRGIELLAVELFGKGSPYAFDSYNNKENWWLCLFPQKSSAELTKKEIRSSVFSALDDISPDVIISSPIVLFAGALSLNWAKANKRKFIMFDDAKPWQFKRNFIVQTVKDILIGQSDGLWFPSAEYAGAYKKFNNKNTLFLYGFNCIDNSRFNTGNKSESANNIIVCVARLVPIKNLDGLLKAWHMVEQNLTNCELMIVGDGPEREMLISLANQLGLKRAGFIGPVDNTALPAFYNKADAFILPSLSETWALVVNEAMAAGLPVLLSNKINACQGLLTEGENGFSFDPLTISEIAGAVINFANLSIQQKNNMSANSLAAVGNMDYENMGTNLVSALHKMQSLPFKKPGVIASLLISRWYGKDDHSAWDKLN